MQKWSDVRTNIKSLTENENDEIELAVQLVATIIKRRQELGLTQRQLAYKTGIKQSAIARFESLGAVPRIDTLCKLSKSLGLEVKLV